MKFWHNCCCKRFMNTVFPRQQYGTCDRWQPAIVIYTRLNPTINGNNGCNTATTPSNTSLLNFKGIDLEKAYWNPK